MSATISTAAYQGEERRKDASPLMNGEAVEAVAARVALKFWYAFGAQAIALIIFGATMYADKQVSAEKIRILEAQLSEKTKDRYKGADALKEQVRVNDKFDDIEREFLRSESERNKRSVLIEGLRRDLKAHVEQHERHHTHPRVGYGDHQFNDAIE